MLVITYDDDNALSLVRTDLLDYCATMIEAMTRAQYAEGVRRQLGSIGVPEQYVIPTVVELREEWPELQQFGPYRIVPIVSFEGRVSVQVQKSDDVIVQFAPHNVAEHVIHAMQVYAAADLDSSYSRYLRGVIGIDAARASAAVAALGEHLHTDLDPPPPAPGPRQKRRGKRRRKRGH